MLSQSHEKRKTELDEALEDIKEGRVFQAENVEDLFNQHDS